MAFPRVFVSSTCYDLGEVRDRLVSFIRSYSFESVVSEKGDIFYHPDLHTHDSCLNEVRNCHLFILIIGGRFGGNYVADTSKSVVNAEYCVAKECGIPVFAFIKNDVYENYKVYLTNAANEQIAKNIHFPAIDNQVYSKHIFAFISDVKNSAVNNGYFPFVFGGEIEEILRKQWAGMFYNFLLNRQRGKEMEVTLNLLRNITLASEKTEELLEHIYRHLDKDNAPEVIQELDNEIKAKKFFSDIFDFLANQRKFEKTGMSDLLKLDTDQEWYDFLGDTGDFLVTDVPDENYNETGSISNALFHYSTHRGLYLDGNLNEEQQEYLNRFEGLFEYYKTLSPQQKEKVLRSFV